MAYFNRTKITDSNGNLINPSQDESIVLLRRIAKLLESNANTDPSMRQRVTIAALDNGTGTITSAGTALPVVATQGTASNLLATVSQATASSLNATAVLAAGTANVGDVVITFGPQGTAAAAGIDSRFYMIDTARNSYATGIRSNLKWS
jgi:hypothetical protein